ncbi:hypothetical protein [Halobacteriovorax sp. JY17]|uniref:hypothetical protein n=1 Tax=Halobacteriovorax sp. JY17 TaxID=2014617 RepID=UPI000C57E66B|nr:hypothetical protein [Halobacteriovorax sp. JY17]PIK16176.1 MAG: hypothetical protein CES88_05430 [Halobacteriovorax sp. JY17]
MTKKKFNLHEKLKSVTKGKKENSFLEQTWSVYPPIIEETKIFNFDYSIDQVDVVTPPIFDKEKFQTKSINEVEEKVSPPVDSLKHCNIEAEESAIITLKKSRKKELDKLNDARRDAITLDSVQETITKKLEFEKEKNVNFRNSLSEMKGKVSDLSKNLDALKSEKMSFEIENSSLEQELLRLEERKTEIENAISELGKENGQLAEKLSNYHRDKNEVENIFKANFDLIKDYKKQIIVNKESINSLLSDIEFKNKEVDQKNESIEVLKDDLEESRTLEANIQSELDEVVIELKKSEKELTKLRDKKKNLKQEIADIEATSKELGNKKASLFKEYNEEESRYFSLTEDLKSLKMDVDSKREVVESHESKIFQIQKSLNELENQKSELEGNLIKRKQDIDKYSKIFKIKSAKLNQLESDNFSLKGEAESLLSSIEESKIQRDSLERKLNQLRIENDKSEGAIALYKKELDSITSENKLYDENISESIAIRELNLEKVSKLRKECEKISKTIDIKQIHLGNIQSNANRQILQVSSLKIKRDKKSETLQSLSNQFNEAKYKIKQSLLVKKSLTNEIQNLNESYSFTNSRYKHHQNLLAELKTQKMKKIDEKISLEHRVNSLITSLQESESELYTEKSIMSSIQGELDEVIKRSSELKVGVDSCQDKISKIRARKNEISEVSNKAFLNKQVMENELLEFERIKGALESELIREQEVYSDLNTKFLNIEAKHRRLESTISEYQDQKSRLVGQIETRAQLISKKEEESIHLSKELQRLDLELDSFKSEFKRSNTNLITSNLNVTTMRDSIRLKKDELQAVKLKYSSLSNNTKDLNVDKEQQLVLIDELERTKSRYIQLIEDMMSKKSKDEVKLSEGNQYIEKLKSDIDALKDNVYVLEKYSKKKAS